MNDLLGLLVVLMLIATLGFFAAFLLWVVIGLVVLLALFCLWAVITTELSGRPSTRSPVREDPSG